MPKLLTAPYELVPPQRSQRPCVAMAASDVEIIGGDRGTIGNLPAQSSAQLKAQLQLSQNQNAADSLWLSQHLAERDGLYASLVLHLEVRGSWVHQPLSVLQVLPWWVQTCFHTLQLSPSCNLINRTLEPATDRGRPSQLQLQLQPSGDCQIELTIERRFLRLEEYPPDPSRGLDLPAARATARSNRATLTVFSDGALLMMPKPDFSMPFNVITYVLTLLALFSGSWINLIVRKPLEHQTGSTAGLKERLINWWEGKQQQPAATTPEQAAGAASEAAASPQLSQPRTAEDWNNDDDWGDKW